jgi:uncharacterized protein (DUF934 family)
MRQIIKGRQVVSDDWTYAGRDELAGAERVVLALADYLAVREGGVSPAPGAQLGVSLAPADDAARLQPHLAELALIVAEFPGSGEGRGYTQGRLLRERYGYRGELRAGGAGVHVDQLYFLARCGFDSFDLAAGEHTDTALAQLQLFTVAYQDGVGSLVHPRRRYDTAAS